MSRTFYVGAGHSIYDSGAESGRLKEAELAAELRNIIAAMLKEKGVGVVMDGEKEINLPLDKSIKLAKTCDSSRIELHFNSADSPHANGVECLSLENHKPLSQAIAHAIATTLCIPLRGEKGWKPDSGGQHSRLGFCREGDGIIVECCFLSNASEIQTYQTKKEHVARAIAEVLILSS